MYFVLQYKGKRVVDVTRHKTQSTAEKRVLALGKKGIKAHVIEVR